MTRKKNLEVLTTTRDLPTPSLDIKVSQFDLKHVSESNKLEEIDFSFKHDSQIENGNMVNIPRRVSGHGVMKRVSSNECGRRVNTQGYEPRSCRRDISSLANQIVDF